MTSAPIGSMRPTSIPVTKLDAAPRPRHLSGAGEPEGAHRPTQRPRGRAGGFPGRAGARQSRDHRRCAQGRRACAQALPSDLGDWRGTSSSCSARSPAARIWRKCRPSISAQSAEREVDAFCRQGFGTLLASLAPGCPGRIVDAGDRDRSTAQRRGRNAEGHDRRPRRHRHGLDQRARVRRASSSRLELPAAAARRHGQARARQLRPHRARTGGNPLGLESDDLVFEKSVNTQHRRDSRERVRDVAVLGRRRRQIRPRSRRPGRGDDGRLRGRMAGGALRRGREEGGQALACHALESRTR